MGLIIGVFVMLMIVGVLLAIGTDVFVPMGVFVCGTGDLASTDAPGVRYTLNQTGCVMMDGSRGSKNPKGRFVRKSLFGSRFDCILVFSFQVGEKRIANCAARMTHRNPRRRMIRIMIQSRLSCSGALLFPFIFIWFRLPAIL